jgi:DNA mismatch repair protein MutS2
MNPADSAEALASLEFAAVLDVIAARAAGPEATAWLRHAAPSTDHATITTELGRTAEVLALRRQGERLEVPPVPDMRAALARLRVDGSVLELGELAGMRQTLVAGRVISAELERIAVSCPMTAAVRAVPVDRALERELERAVGDDGELLDGASAALGAARREVHAARERLIKRLEAIARDHGGGGVTIREGRYVIPVRRDERHRPDGIIHDESGSAGTLFVEPTATIAFGNALRAAVAEEERQVLAVLRALTERLRPERDAIAALHRMALTVDTLQARASWALDCEAECPEITGAQGELRLHRARHPLLLARGLDVVPFDLVLEPGERTLLLSGPNTGGKTVLLKTVALVVLLAQSGIIPPVGPGSRLPVIARVFVDIGDHQSLHADLSTFSAHVGELRRILAEADGASLVILDEVGSGTDPAEGGALAMAVLEELTRRGTLTVATTHLGTLKTLATTVPGVVNGSLQFDAATLSPTYRFAKGIPGRSYGIAIARRLGVDAGVLARAESLVPEAERELDRLLASVEAREQELRRDEHHLIERTVDVDRREAVVTGREASQAEREGELRRQEKVAERERAQQAKAYLLEARKRVEQALAQARGAVDEAAAKEARRLVEEGVRHEAERLDDSESVGSPAGDHLAIGGRVRLDTGATGELVELRGDGRAVVQVGTMRLVLKAASLTGLRDRGRAPSIRPALPVADAPVREAAWEIDLRGMRADEAATTVLAALDGAVLAEQPHLRIIHGMGTGVLREAVRELLGRDSRVASFEFAPRQQGGTGVTVAVLR